MTGHEAGAVEARGHKVLTIPQKDGKITADGIRAYMKAFEEDDSRDHIVQPGMVYISQPTELGTLYSLAELEAISAAAHEYGLPLFVDGARLAYGLAAEGNDVTLPDLARLTDAFYIGGTKCGALIGEALVITNPDIMPHFFTTMKQQGAILAKGRLVGITFEVLMTENRYVEAGRHGDELAQLMKKAFIEKATSSTSTRRRTRSSRSLTKPRRRGLRRTSSSLTGTTSPTGAGWCASARLGRRIRKRWRSSLRRFDRSLG